MSPTLLHTFFYHSSYAHNLIQGVTSPCLTHAIYGVSLYDKWVLLITGPTAFHWLRHHHLLCILPDSSGDPDSVHESLIAEHCIGFCRCYQLHWCCHTHKCSLHMTTLLMHQVFFVHIKGPMKTVLRRILISERQFDDNHQWHVNYQQHENFLHVLTRANKRVRKGERKKRCEHFILMKV